MNPIRTLLTAAALAAGATPALADSAVEVRFSDPAKFSDLRSSRFATEREIGRAHV